MDPAAAAPPELPPAVEVSEFPEEPSFEPANEDEYVRGWANAAKYSGWSDTHLKSLVTKQELIARRGAPQGTFNERPYWFAKADLDAIKRVPAPARGPERSAYQVPSGISPTAANTPAPSGARAPATPRTGLGTMIAPSERVKIYRRGDSGKLEYLNAYQQRDLQGSKDVETFIQIYLVPTYGFGEYVIELFNGEKLVRETSYTFAARVHERGGDHVNVNEILKTALDNINAAKASAPAPPTLAEQAAQMKALQEAFGGGGQNQMMPMLMMMQMMQQRPVGPDPSVAALTNLVTQLAAKVEQLASAPPLPPPMPSAPPEPAVDVIKLVESVKNLIPQPAPAPPQAGFGVKDLLTMMPTIQHFLDKLTGKEQIEAILGEMAEMRDERKKGGLAEVVENIKMLREVSALDPFRKPEQQEPGSFWDVIKDITSTDKLAEIRAIVEASGRNGAPAGRPAARGGAGGGRPAGGGPSRVKQQPAPPQEQHEVDEEPPQAPTVVNAEAWAAEIKAYVAKLEKADNDLARIATGLALFSVVTSQDSFAWAKADAIRYATEGNRDRLLWLIGESMGALAAPEYGSLSEEARQATVNAFTVNIDKVMGVLTGKVKIGRAPAAKKAAAQAAPETAPAKKAKLPKKDKAAKKAKPAKEAAPAEPVAVVVVAPTPPAPATNGVHHPEVIDDEADEDGGDEAALA